MTKAFIMGSENLNRNEVTEISKLLREIGYLRVFDALMVDQNISQGFDLLYSMRTKLIVLIVPPDAIGNGFQIVQKIRANPRSSRTPLILALQGQTVAPPDQEVVDQLKQVELAFPLKREPMVQALEMLGLINK